MDAGALALIARVREDQWRPRLGKRPALRVRPLVRVDVDAHQRIAVLEAALRAQALTSDYGDILCFCGDDARNPPLTEDHIPACKQARAALAPPERSRVAAAPEPPR